MQLCSEKESHELQSHFRFRAIHSLASAFELILTVLVLQKRLQVRGKPTAALVIAALL